MPKNLQADIDWHHARIAFYEQALAALDTAPDVPDRARRQAGLKEILADLNRTLFHLERELAERTKGA